jgi:hypothetical protein
MTETTKPELSFEVAIANYVGPIKASVDMLLDRNPELSVPARAAIMRIAGKLMPLSNVEHLERWRDAFDAG